ncbi:hypothetical protein MASR2M117_00250 [Paludibacter sp.]
MLNFFKIFHRHIVLVFLVLISTGIFAVPATPFPITRILPDGSELVVQLRGDEHFHYELTDDGYLIEQEDNGFYSYAEKDKTGLIRSIGIRVSPIGKRTAIEKKYLLKAKQNPDFKQEILNRKIQKAPPRDDKRNTYPRTGSPKSIVILVNFLDVRFVTPSPKTTFSKMLNEEGYSANGGTGSARDYFIASSNGVSSPEFVVVGPYTLPFRRSYYGANDANRDDIRPDEMVKDACNLAAADGVDFGDYDTDNDGKVDNVFVYYAGHNEAEGGPAESIWPHRWEVTGSFRLNNKIIAGYACTSELRGSSGSEMCGIGTFVHEFGHVYGLPDYYNTVEDGKYTLSVWNVMDEGAYLNNGRTPPTYSAYDRFYLGWLNPKVLSHPQKVLLEDLQTSNSAYLITESGTHNLNPYNPKPVEFFTVENRQKKGWDAYLPAGGMLITRIFYNSSAWTNNNVNNDPKALGVDIIEADGKASKNNWSGDPFPGSTNRTEYSPVLRNGTEIGRPITNIRLDSISGLIIFNFMGGGDDMVQFTNKAKNIHIYKDLSSNDIYLDKGAENDNNQIYVYNMYGHMERYIESKNQIVIIKDLAPNTIYIIKCGKNTIKVSM